MEHHDAIKKSFAIQAEKFHEKRVNRHETIKQSTKIFFISNIFVLFYYMIQMSYGIL